jgi:hypothetical protein
MLLARAMDRKTVAKLPQKSGPVDSGPGAFLAYFQQALRAGFWLGLCGVASGARGSDVLEPCWLSTSAQSAVCGLQLGCGLRPLADGIRSAFSKAYCSGQPKAGSECFHVHSGILASGEGQGAGRLPSAGPLSWISRRASPWRLSRGGPPESLTYPFELETIVRGPKPSTKASPGSKATEQFVNCAELQDSKPRSTSRRSDFLRRDRFERAADHRADNLPREAS